VVGEYRRSVIVDRQRFLLVVFALSACHKPASERKGERPAASETAGITSSATTGAPRTTPAALGSDAPPGESTRAAAAATSARPRPPPDPPRPPNEDEKTNRKAYLDALERGRGATVARRYDEAVLAFGQAVEKCAGVSRARAYAERGYAQLLARRYEAALQDFEEASNQPSDAKLAAQVWFNRGLADEALGRAKDADLSFFRSNRLRRSKVAEERLAGKTVCPVTVDRARIDARPYAGWFAWWKALNDGVEHDDAQQLKRGWGYFPPPEYPPKNESQAQQLYCPSCAGDGPWDAWFGGLEYDTHVLARQDGKLWDYGVVGGGAHVLPSGGSCGGGVDVQFGRSGRFMFARAVTFMPMQKSFVLADPDSDVKGEAVKACPDDNQGSAATAPCDFWCVSSSSTETYFVFDTSHPARVMVVGQRNDFPLAMSAPPFDVKLEPSATGFEVRGEGCAAVPYESP
jgi:hypothetical protein